MTIGNIQRRFMCDRHKNLLFIRCHSYRNYHPPMEPTERYDATAFNCRIQDQKVGSPHSIAKDILFLPLSQYRCNRSTAQHQNEF